MAQHGSQSFIGQVTEECKVANLRPVKESISSLCTCMTCISVVPVLSCRREAKYIPIIRWRNGLHVEFPLETSVRSSAMLGSSQPTTIRSFRMKWLQNWRPEI